MDKINHTSMPMKSPAILIMSATAVVILAGCEASPFANANANCKQTLRDSMRDPRGVSIRYLDRTERSRTDMRIRYTVRGTNAFGATTEAIYWCQWEQTAQLDDGYRYRISTGRSRR